MSKETKSNQIHKIVIDNLIIHEPDAFESSIDPQTGFGTVRLVYTQEPRLCYENYKVIASKCRNSRRIDIN